MDFIILQQLLNTVPVITSFGERENFVPFTFGCFPVGYNICVETITLNGVNANFVINSLA